MDEETQLPDPSQLPPLDGSSDPWVGQMLSGYHLIKRIGEGGMGIVYLARHQSLDRLAAVKFLGAHMVGDPAYIQRFFQEARLAATLNHPNVVSVYDAGKVGENVYYIVMEYIEGTNLRALVKDRGKLLVSEAVDYMRQAATGLGYAHKKGIVHRDVKPDNLMLTTEGVVKIGDLGLAKWTGNQDGGMTGTGAVLGTPYYISPEQIRGARDVDARTDIYSLGGTFFNLLTGKIPYEGSSPAVIMAMHLNDPIPDPRKARPPLDADVCTLIQKMLAKDPKERFQSMEEVEAALTHYRSRPSYTSVDVPVPTPPPAAAPASPGYWKAALFGCIGLLAGLTLLVILAFFFLRYQSNIADSKAAQAEAQAEAETPPEKEEPATSESTTTEEEKPSDESMASEESPAESEEPVAAAAKPTPVIAPPPAPAKPIVEYSFANASAALPEGVQCFIWEPGRKPLKVTPQGITLLRSRSSWQIERANPAFLILSTESPPRLRGYFLGASFYVPLLKKDHNYEALLKLRSRGEAVQADVLLEPGNRPIQKISAGAEWATQTISLPDDLPEESVRILVGFRGAGHLDIAEIRVLARQK